jgi:putative transposase
MSADWCGEVITEAIRSHGTPQIINSDQGSQFTGDVYISLLKSHSIQISMDGRGRARDNIFIERFWRSIKYENIYLNPCENGQQLYKQIEDYMQFYNNKRPHESLNYSFPNQIYEYAA